MAADPDRPGRREANEAALLEAAAALLDEGASFAGLRVEEIAQRAGLGRTNFYFYFGDKRVLLTRLAEEAAGELYGQADRWWHGEGSADELGEIIAAVVGVWMRHGAVLNAVVQTAAVDAEVRTLWRGLAGRFVDATRERIEHEQARGAATGVPAAETAFALVWMTERACYQHVQDGGGDPRALVEALTGIWRRSVYAPLV
jgi:AcrR family transcriptional regulator